MPKVLSSPTSGASRGRSRRVSSTLAEINVIPLVDVMLVLLIIFMVAAPMLQKGVDVNLPVAARPTRMSEERLYVSVPASYRSDRRVFIGEEGIPIDVLSERMRQTMVGRDQKEVFLRGDADVRLQELMDVMDRLKAGGVERVGIVAQQKAP